MDERTFVDGEGVEIYSRWWLVDEPRGLVVIAHGASEHSGRYDRFARALNQAGLAAVAVDHRGHGRTAASTGPGVTGPGGGQAIIDDIHQLRREASAAVGSAVPVLLFGHSLGCLMAVAYVTRYSDGLAGAVLCGMPAAIDDTETMGQLLRGLADAGLRDESAADMLAAHNAPFEPGRTRFDWLSRDETEVDLYIADPMCGDANPITYGYLIDLFEVLAPAAGRLPAVSCPALVIAGREDPAAAMGAHAETLAAALEKAGVDVTAKVYEGDRHELLNETNRDEVTADVIGWMTERLGR